jgi:hypothetical protein
MMKVELPKWVEKLLKFLQPLAVACIKDEIREKFSELLRVIFG